MSQDELEAAPDDVLFVSDCLARSSFDEAESGGLSDLVELFGSSPTSSTAYLLYEKLRKTPSEQWVCYSAVLAAKLATSLRDPQSRTHASMALALLLRAARKNRTPFVAADLIGGLLSWLPELDCSRVLDGMALTWVLLEVQLLHPQLLPSSLLLPLFSAFIQAASNTPLPSCDQCTCAPIIVLLSALCSWVGSAAVAEAQQAAWLLLDVWRLNSSNESRLGCQPSLADAWIFRCLAACFWRHEGGAPRGDSFSSDLRLSVLAAALQAATRYLPIPADDRSYPFCCSWILRCIDSVSYSRLQTFREARSRIVLRSGVATAAIIAAIIPASLSRLDRYSSALAINAIRAVGNSSNSVVEDLMRIGLGPVIHAAKFIQLVFPGFFVVPNIDKSLDRLCSWATRRPGKYSHYCWREPQLLPGLQKPAQLILGSLCQSVALDQQWLLGSFTELPAKALWQTLQLLQPFHVTHQGTRLLVEFVINSIAGCRTTLDSGALDLLWDSGTIKIDIERLAPRFSTAEACYALCRVGLRPERAFESAQIPQVEMDLAFRDGIAMFVMPLVESVCDGHSASESLRQLATFFRESMVRRLSLFLDDRESLPYVWLDLAWSLISYCATFDGCLENWNPAPAKACPTQSLLGVINVAAFDPPLLGIPNDAPAILSFIRERVGMPGDSFLLFHATTRANATRPLEERAVGRGPHDFGTKPAVYFTTKLEQALEHKVSLGTGGRRSSAEAILVLIVPREFAREQANCLRFSYTTTVPSGDWDEEIGCWPSREWHEAVIASRACNREHLLVRRINNAGATYGASWRSYSFRNGPHIPPAEWWFLDRTYLEELPAWTDTNYPPSGDPIATTLERTLDYARGQDVISDHIAVYSQILEAMSALESLVILLSVVPHEPHW